VITGVNHIGIATSNLEDVTELYKKLLPGALLHQEEVPDQNVRISSFSLGETHIEFLEPTTPESPVAKFLEKNPRGAIHHLAFSSDDVVADLARLKEDNFRLLDETPRRGMGGSKIAFLHPKASGGILVELCQD
jgi:methylmalonyl-CoA/ethylmalonyl-CoA epimerase